MASNLCGKFYLSARRPVITESNRGSFVFVLVGAQILSFSYISSDRTQDIRTRDTVALGRIVLLSVYINKCGLFNQYNE